MRVMLKLRMRMPRNIFFYSIASHIPMYDQEGRPYVHHIEYPNGVQVVWVNPFNEAWLIMDAVSKGFNPLPWRFKGVFVSINPLTAGFGVEPDGESLWPDYYKFPIEEVELNV